MIRLPSSKSSTPNPTPDNAPLRGPAPQTELNRPDAEQLGAEGLRGTNLPASGLRIA